MYNCNSREDNNIRYVFFNSIIHDSRYIENIRKIVDDRINKNLFQRELANSIFGKDINEVIDERLDSKLSSSIRKRVPSIVTRELHKQLPQLLNDSTIINNAKIEMNIIFEKQKEELDTKLKGTVKNILDSVTNNNQYQKIAESWVNNFDKKGYEAINKINNDANWLIADNQRRYDEIRQEYQDTINEFEKYKKDIEDNKNNIRQVRLYTHYFMGGCIIAGAGIILSTLK